MELELVRVGQLDPDDFMFDGFTCLAYAGDTFTTIIGYYYDVLRDPAILKTYHNSLYIVGRVPIHQEDAWALGLKVGDIL